MKCDLCPREGIKRCDKCGQFLCTCHRFTEGCAAWVRDGRHEPQPCPEHGAWGRNKPTDA
jgi:hypothetical protein